MKIMIDDVKRSIDFKSHKFDNIVKELKTVKKENKKSERHMIRETDQEFKKIFALE